MSEFNYEEAFSRNVGFVTEDEQQILRGKKIAIAGMGGVGGIHLLALTRLGVGSFAIADFDTYEVANFNRQFGANMKTVNTSKVHTMADMARDINPELKIDVFEQGVTDDNMVEFLKDVDLFVDGFDFFVLGMRARLFKYCHENGIPAVTAAPLGMSTAYLVFQPDGMSFEQYFRLEKQNQFRQFVRFLIGLAPAKFQIPAIVVADTVDLVGKKGPSTPMGCLLCAGVVGSEALKILLKRGSVYPAPYYHQFDAYQGKWRRGYCPGGNANPVRKIIERLVYNHFRNLSDQAALRTLQAPVDHGSVLENILEDARWAPSGDNEQPWRFEILDDMCVHVHFRITLENVIEFNGGEPIYVSAGIFLETMALAAAQRGYRIVWHLEKEADEGFTVVVQLKADEFLDPDQDAHLYAHIRTRSVNRKLFHFTPLSAQVMTRLEKAVGPDWRLLWRSGIAEKLKIARLTAQATDIRLRVKENFSMISKIIDWDNMFSPRAVPAKALGISPPTRKIMAWMLKKPQERIEKFNKWMGTGGARLEMDVLPALFSGTLFTMVPADPGKTDIRANRSAQIDAGRAVQRLWLEAAAQGVSFQPSYAALVFSYYGGRHQAFSNAPGLTEKAEKLYQDWADLFGENASHVAFMGRFGYPRKTKFAARSVRLPLKELIVKDHR